ncbi:hypothetical protein K461DRAFT_316532 [Myriangium duriaei CBS 260.36]|uniref:Uncharacterized protein n=1 Tax=Myriangium duriaei CBS 260.36 TaxID=1168546 RepID=A0A9P4MHR5_9PEZI|nr:hypothetical protein K461DRAFT_316532 [Myriangium duriaei CBS 260.36]
MTNGIRSVEAYPVDIVNSHTTTEVFVSTGTAFDWIVLASPAEYPVQGGVWKNRYRHIDNLYNYFTSIRTHPGDAAQPPPGHRHVIIPHWASSGVDWVRPEIIKLLHVMKTFRHNVDVDGIHQEMVNWATRHNLVVRSLDDIGSKVPGKMEREVWRRCGVQAVTSRLTTARIEVSIFCMVLSDVFLRCSISIRMLAVYTDPSMDATTKFSTGESF